MRVIGGAAKGRRLKSFKGRTVRPTADRVKEALFNILPHDLSGLRVLDLFAGTGNLTLEALSRGAREACLVDRSQGAAKMIRANLHALGFSQRSRVVVMPVLRAIRSLAAKEERFDLIFVDPPYENGWVERVLVAITRENLLEKEGILVVEHSAREQVRENYSVLGLHDQRQYGDTVLSFFGFVGFSLLQDHKGKTWRALV